MPSRGAASEEVLELVELGAYGIWIHNGHQLLDALLHVHRHADRADVREAAGAEYDTVLRRRLLWDAYELRFRDRIAAEQ